MPFLSLIFSKVGGYLIGGLAIAALAGGLTWYINHLKVQVADREARLEAQAATVAVQANQLDQLQAINKANLDELEKERTDRAKAEQQAQQAQEQATKAQADAEGLKARIKAMAQRNDVSIPASFADALQALKMGAGGSQ